ncbi:Ecm19p NDAI_0J02250 [Naumovozyma dairenensis CBS 421]|uniref:Protein ECM19 n=1 Tax=Naumovozyma dairenensis (strain ATCC 10597 / BCRC 20456 / CBS 421 / NBRC 0211 / NRRL Y-12639) TaxID=1071378 RepID=G0WH39_NAUDC|nr:hypothetical protein NDAI_0J02250 [Naumovozyma dairenensis CBS 421]CCD27117.1 hypothetical protein NDAI_0J02250 [Naumovozyma dairenensis CBS 421]
MARLRGFDVLTVAVVSAASVYMGINFFQPIVLQQLDKNGGLRPDIDVDTLKQLQVPTTERSNQDAQRILKEDEQDLVRGLEPSPREK